MTTGPQPPASSGPDQNAQGAGQNIHVTGGNNSPININAPSAHAERGGTANANINESAPTTPTPWWNRSIVLWTALGAVAAVAAVVIPLLTAK